MSRLTRMIVPPPAEPAEPGTHGILELRAESPLHGTVEHKGEYVYVGPVRGFLAFAPACNEPVLYLTRKEVISFRKL